jgi:two-component system response regulator PilR (NtrC family)
MSRHNALIIDDEPDIRELLEITLNRMDIQCVCVNDLTSAKRTLKTKNFDICLTDMKLPDGNGVEFVSYLQNNYPNVPIAVITAHGNMETAIQALKSGAFDFITKPVDLAVLRSLVNDALNISTGKIRSEKNLVGESDVIKRIRETIVKLARSQAPIYISGESGVGKELVARMIHEHGPRNARAFVPVNCGAIPVDLMESEFFGHRKGSFTGADTDKEGLFQAAEGGTLFLDEVAELPPNMQVKLLRVIQEKKIRPIGEQREIAVNVRILSATHKDLTRLAQQGLFRQDLYYRINVIELNVPPLRDRREDIPLLIDHILSKYLNEVSGTGISLSEEAIKLLTSYQFPGNIRELENILERAITLCDGNQIRVTDLKIPNQKSAVELQHKEDDTVELDTYLQEVERKLIVQALEKNRWNKTATAKSLGINLRALRYRMEKLGLDE